jgi:hypothetical protein
LRSRKVLLPTLAGFARGLRGLFSIAGCGDRGCDSVFIELFFR